MHSFWNQPYTLMQVRFISFFGSIYFHQLCRTLHPVCQRTHGSNSCVKYLVNSFIWNKTEWNKEIKTTGGAFHSAEPWVLQTIRKHTDGEVVPLSFTCLSFFSLRDSLSPCHWIIGRRITVWSELSWCQMVCLHLPAPLSLNLAGINTIKIVLGCVCFRSWLGQGIC